jgi:murein DD-endopeptidase MepM/ murein hydrolase activator NlpD
VDLSAGTGTPVYAAATGTVIWAGDKGPNGNLVGIRHADGFESYYAHLSRYAPGMHVGLEIRQRQLVGYVGSTGRSTGPHLHFGLMHHGHFVDPMRELNGPGRLMPSAALPGYRRLVRTLTAELGRIELAPAPAHHGAAVPEGGDED